MTNRQADRDRAERLAQQLRANLARRKAQARGAAVDSADQRESASEPGDVEAPAAR